MATPYPTVCATSTLVVGKVVVATSPALPLTRQPDRPMV